MIKGLFEDDKMKISISVDKFIELWDDSYADNTGYSIAKYSDLELSSKAIDLDSFVADMMLSILDPDGNEDEDANNEYFENYEAINCFISKVENGIVYIGGTLSKL